MGINNEWLKKKERGREKQFSDEVIIIILVNHVYKLKFKWSDEYLMRMGINKSTDVYPMITCNQRTEEIDKYMIKMNINNKSTNIW